METYFTPDTQSGQTLIETIVAIFILTTALTAALALTIYVYANSGKSINQIVAINLAQEGIDVIRNMRDTNWLESDAKGDVWGLINCNINSKDSPCFPRAWEGVPGNGFHNYTLTSDGDFQLQFNSSANTWGLSPSPSSYALYLQSDGAYTSSGSGAPAYSRKITLSHNTALPFSTGDLSELIVTSTVGWSGRGCSSMNSSYDPTTTNCSVVISESLTNWKDYK